MRIIRNMLYAIALSFAIGVSVPAPALAADTPAASQDTAGTSSGAGGTPLAAPYGYQPGGYGWGPGMMYGYGGYGMGPGASGGYGMGGYGMGPGMMYGYGNGGYGMGFGGVLWMIVVWGIPLLLLFLLARYVFSRMGGNHAWKDPQSGRTALDMLKESYARGEIQRDEYLQKRDDLLEK